jgi:hypothetical protein
MRKRPKKLELSKETLASLAASHLEQAAAAYSSPNGCSHPCPVTLTCHRTC